MRRREALDRLKAGKIEFMDMGSLAPPISAKELDAATGQNSEAAAAELLAQAQLAVQAEEIAQAKTSWWKLLY